MLFLIIYVVFAVCLVAFCLIFAYTEVTDRKVYLETNRSLDVLEFIEGKSTYLTATYTGIQMLLDEEPTGYAFEFCIEDPLDVPAESPLDIPVGSKVLLRVIPFYEEAANVTLLGEEEEI